MALEIEIDEKIDANNDTRIDCLTRLLQLYMVPNRVTRSQWSISKANPIYDTNTSIIKYRPSSNEK